MPRLSINGKAGRSSLFFTIFRTENRLPGMKRLLLLLPFFIMGKPSAKEEPGKNTAKQLLAEWHRFSSTLHSGKYECIYRHATGRDTVTQQAEVVFSHNTGIEFKNFWASAGTTHFLQCDSGYYCISDEQRTYWEPDRGITHPLDRFYSRTINFEKLDQLLRSKVVTFRSGSRVNNKTVNGEVVIASWPNGTHTDSAVFVFHPENRNLERMVLYAHSDFETYYDDVRITSAMYYPAYSRNAYRPVFFMGKWAKMKTGYTWN